MNRASKDYLWFAAICFACVLLFGCKSGPQTAANIVREQTPGTASGAGGTLVGPANSATPTTQVAERSFTFQPPTISVPLPRPSVPVIAIPGVTPPVIGLPAPQPVTVTERVSTTIGHHQDAAGIIAQAAKLAGGLTKIQWLGIGLIVLGVAALLWCAGHDEGYPLVYWKIIGGGLLLAMFGDSPWWLAVLIPAALLYAAQRLGLLRITP